jgi:hypothetical protein
MNRADLLFSNGDLADVLNHKLNKITNAVADWNEDKLLSASESDVYESLQAQFLVEPVVLDREGITADSIEDGFATVSQFDEQVTVRQTTVTISVPFTGDRSLLTLRTSSFKNNPPRATVGNGELKVHWSGGARSQDAAAIRQSLDSQLDTIEQWLRWSTAQVTTYNESARQRIVSEAQARKARVLANRDLQASLGFPMRKRADAATYTVPITRKKIVPRRTEPASRPFQPEPALDDNQYEAALAVLKNQRNQLERSPSTSAHLGEEQIRDLLLIGLNGQFEGRAAGEVFNGKGKTDILIREQDRHIFIGECKIWRGPRLSPTRLTNCSAILSGAIQRPRCCCSSALRARPTPYPRPSSSSVNIRTTSATDEKQPTRGMTSYSTQMVTRTERSDLPSFPSISPEQAPAAKENSDLGCCGTGFFFTRRRPGGRKPGSPRRSGHRRPGRPGRR